MPQPNVEVDCERETVEARAEMLRPAEEQGGRPRSFDELRGDPTSGRQT